MGMGAGEGGREEAGRWASAGIAMGFGNGDPLGSSARVGKPPKKAHGPQELLC